MEELTEVFEADLAVSSIPNDPIRKHPRFALYKARNNRPDQEERRRRLLEEQKKKRSELYNAGRGLIATLEENEVSDDMDWSVSKTTKLHPEIYKDQLMFSEWLVEVPEDLEQEWYMVPCPEGRRTIIVAYGARTMAFSKSGYNTATFKSLLPGGSYKAGRGCTKLDCIWSAKDHTYYVLDILSWRHLSVVDCETEFRFYWLRTKLQEMHKLGTSCDENRYAFKSLPHYKCTKDVLTEVMANENMFSIEGPRVDGLLFYHSKTHYMAGHTPLVGWLKPHMMPEILGIQVAAVYLQEDMDSKPNTSTKKSRHTTNKHKAEVEEEMETANPVDCDADPGDMKYSADKLAIMKALQEI